MSSRVQTAPRSCTADHESERSERPLRFLATSRAAAPRATDPSWAPRNVTVAIASNEHEARAVFRLRHRVYIHEQGFHLNGIDSQHSELLDPLDPCSYLWYVAEGDAVVGTLTQTIIGPDFDLRRLPAALELGTFPRSAGPFGYSSRFAIAPDHRSMWVLPSIVRHTYAHGRMCGANFDFMITSPALVPLFERLGYLRYTQSGFDLQGVGLLIPMVLPATDLEHLRSVRSACLPAAEHFPDEPHRGAWLRANRPIIDVYYGSGREGHSAALAQRSRLPLNVAIELSSLSFAHHFPAGTMLRRIGDRVTCTFLAIDGDLSVKRGDGGEESRARCAPDGVAFARVAIRCETDAVVLCVPDSAVARLKRRYAEHSDALEKLLEQTASASEPPATC